MSNRGWAAALNRGWVVRGRRWSIRCSRRSAERRSLDWAGIGPARASARGLVCDVRAGQGDPLAPIVGVAVHAGPLLVIVLAEPRRPLQVVSEPMPWYLQDAARRAGLIADLRT